MNLLQYIDMYCERTAPGLFGEPLNLLSNFAFFGAALWVWQRHAKHGRDFLVLALLLLLIAAGSAAFHMFATVWSAILDISFISLFVVFFLFRYLVRTGKVPTLVSALLVLVFIACSVGFTVAMPKGAMNGSVPYLAPLFAMFLLATWAALRQLHGAGILAMASFVFVIGIALRTMDQAICDRFVHGTHFAWHVCTAIVLALSMNSLAKLTKKYKPLY